MFDGLSQIIHDTAVEKGFWESTTTDAYVAKMALVHSEISEILEAYRKQQGEEKIAEEFADVIIRLLDLWRAMYDNGLVTSLDDAVTHKIEKNTRRPRLHGNLI